MPFNHSKFSKLTRTNSKSQSKVNNETEKYNIKSYLREERRVEESFGEEEARKEQERME